MTAHGELAARVSATNAAEVAAWEPFRFTDAERHAVKRALAVYRAKLANVAEGWASPETKRRQMDQAALDFIVNVERFCGEQMVERDDVRDDLSEVDKPAVPE